MNSISLTPSTTSHEPNFTRTLQPTSTQFLLHAPILHQPNFTRSPCPTHQPNFTRSPYPISFAPPSPYINPISVAPSPHYINPISFATPPPYINLISLVLPTLHQPNFTHTPPLYITNSPCTPLRLKKNKPIFTCTPPPSTLDQPNFPCTPHTSTKFHLNPNHPTSTQFHSTSTQFPLHACPRIHQPIFTCTAPTLHPTSTQFPLHAPTLDQPIFTCTPYMNSISLTPSTTLHSHSSPYINPIPLARPHPTSTQYHSLPLPHTSTQLHTLPLPYINPISFAPPSPYINSMSFAPPPHYINPISLAPHHTTSTQFHSHPHTTLTQLHLYLRKIKVSNIGRITILHIKYMLGYMLILLKFYSHDHASS